MRRFAVALCALATMVGCHARVPRPKVLGQLDRDAAVFVYLEPPPLEAQRLSLTLASVAASGPGETPLELALPTIGFEPRQGQRLLAFGKVPPGSYNGLAIRVRRATLKREQGTADLLVPEAPARVVVPFSVDAGRTIVIWVSLASMPPTGGGIELTPAFAGQVPPRPILEVLGLSAATGWDSVVELDATRRRVVSVIPTGRSPQGLTLDRLQSRMYVALAREDEIHAYDLLSGDQVLRIRLTPGDAPREVALTPDRQLLVAINAASYTASFIDPTPGVELNRVQVGPDPWSILVDRSGVRAYVFNRRGNTITVLDLATRSVATTVSTDAEPLRGALSRAGDRLYVAQAGSPYLLVLKLPDLTLDRRVFVGFGASDVLVDRRTDLIYVAKREEARIEVFDPLQLLALASIPLPDAVSYLSIDDTRNALLALMPERRAVAVVDLAGRAITATFDVGDDPYSVILFQQRP